MPALHIDDVQVIPNTATETLTLRVIVANQSKQPQGATLSGLLSTANVGAKWAYPTVPPVSTRIEPGATRTLTLGPVKWKLGRASWWWPNIPFNVTYRAQLHKIALTLEGNGKIKHTQSVRFGFCMPGQQGNHYTLNGVRINLRGDSLPEETIGTDAFARLPGFLPPTKSGSGKDATTNPGWPGAVHNYQHLNFNVVRMHQVPGTRYMMDVCDELGLLVIPETAIRSGKSGVAAQTAGEEPNREILPPAKQHPEDYATHLRELIQRDRNHPSVFKWSLASGLAGESEAFIRALYDVVRKEDPIRPCSIDDDLPQNMDYPSWPMFTVIAQRSQPPGTPNAQGGTPRADRPYGQGKFISPKGNTQQGSVWYGLQTLSLRLHDNADIRPYTLIDLWPGVIPGLKPNNFPDPSLPPNSLEQGGQSLLNPRNPAQDPTIYRIEQCFAPVCAWDMDWVATNTPSTDVGMYPAIFPKLTPKSKTERTLTIFNDDLKGSAIDIEVVTLLHPKPTKNVPLATLRRTLTILPGFRTTLNVPVQVPDTIDNEVLEMKVTLRKEGVVRFENSMLFMIPGPKGSTLEYLSRDDTTRGDWLKSYGQQSFMVPVRKGVATFHDMNVELRRGSSFMTVLDDNKFEEGINALYEWDKSAFLDDPRLPIGGNGLTERHPVAMTGPVSIAIRADSKDNKAHTLSIYLLDYERKGLAVEIDAFDLNGIPIGSKRFDHYEEGSYVRYRFTGAVVLMVYPIPSDQPPLISGVFLDP